MMEVANVFQASGTSEDIQSLLSLHIKGECDIADDAALTRRKCRMNCGVHSIIPNVLMFLIKLDIVCKE